MIYIYAAKASGKSKRYIRLRDCTMQFWGLIWTSTIFMLHKTHSLSLSRIINRNNALLFLKYLSLPLPLDAQLALALWINGLVGELAL